ncbi:MAG: alpha-hydroxy-acid oxidizing protein [Pseudomonadota bacterium]
MGKLERAVNIADLRRMGRARLPAVVFDYLDGAAGQEHTLRDNVRAFRRWGFRPQHGVEIKNLDLSVTVMGQRLDWPALAAPIGYSALMHKDGERGTARAARKAGIGGILSTISGARLEDVAATSCGRVGIASSGPDPAAIFVHDLLAVFLGEGALLRRGKNIEHGL